MPTPLSPFLVDLPAFALPASGLAVLVVEDVAILRALCRRVLERAGYAVLTAVDGLDALAVAAAHPGRVDLLVADVGLPGMSGPEVAARLADARPGLRVLFTSGYPDREAVGPFLAKPFRPADLLARVREVMAGRGA